MLIAFNKPYNVVCRFGQEPGHECLADYISIPEIYPAGRLDTDSEGLLLLTDDGPLQHRITDPKHKLEKVYWAQVEGIPERNTLWQLRRGIMVQGKKTLPAKANIIAPPKIWPRTPPIRERRNIPTTWVELTITEGRNRQVRRMTAAVGHPTLRLIRVRIGPWELGDLAPGQWREIDLFPT